MRVSNEDRLALRDLVHPSWTTNDQVFRSPAVFIELDQPGSTSAPEWSRRPVGRRGLSRLTNRPGKLTAVAMPLGRAGDCCERPRCPDPDRRCAGVYGTFYQVPPMLFAVSHNWTAAYETAVSLS